MALTPSTARPDGFARPDFALPDVITGRPVTPGDLAGDRGLVVVFLCRHCPYVVHVLPALAALARDFLGRGIAFAGICANDAAAYPDDAPPRLAAMVRERDIPFPVLHDADQRTARAFGAACTPEFFVFAPSGALHYHGRMDGSTPGNGVPCTGSDLRAALDALLGGRPAPEPQLPSMGCSIKWK